MNSTRTLIFAFLAGLLLIFGVRLLVPGLAGATIAVTTAVVIIIIVGFYYHRKCDDSEDRQIAGDNLYYLGLLFTLLSLIMALLQLFIFDVQESINDRANELIGNFGVALFSTVAGILARILFQSSKEELETESEEKQKNVASSLPSSSVDIAIDSDISDLREDLARLRLVLREASDAFLHFTRISSEQSSSVVDHTGAMMQKQYKDLEVSSLHQLEQMNLNLKSIAEIFNTEMTTLSNHCIDIVGKFTQHISAETNQSIIEKSQAWNDVAEKMRMEGEGHIKAIYGELNALLASTKQTWSEMQNLSQSIGNSVTGMRENSKSLQAMVNDAVKASTEMRLLLEGMTSARSELDAAASVVTKSTNELQSSVNEIAGGQEKLVAELNDERLSAVKEYRKTTTQIADRVSEQVESDGAKMSSAIKEISDNLEKHQKIGADQLAQAQFLSKQMAGEAKEWSKLAEHTRKSLVEAIENLVGTVRKS